MRELTWPSMPSWGLQSFQLFLPAFNRIPSSGHCSSFLFDRLIPSRIWLGSTIYIANKYGSFPVQFFLDDDKLYNLKQNFFHRLPVSPLPITEQATVWRASSWIPCSLLADRTTMATRWQLSRDKSHHWNATCFWFLCWRKLFLNIQTCPSLQTNYSEGVFSPEGFTQHMRKTKQNKTNEWHKQHKNRVLTHLDSVNHFPPFGVWIIGRT